ncbi:hypothetical protein ABZZ04_23280 [Streptomyces sp. NPDC006435]|uniref:hypothetical protein n=1 Tax=Streptomyces sp. NPDC006435 TaxID=3154300 RepID=UPI0033BB27B5
MTGRTTEEIVTAFNRLCRESPQLRATAAGLAAGSYRHDGDRAALLARPVFAPLAGMRSFATDLLATLEVAAQLPGRLFDGDVERYCEVLGMDRRRVSLLNRLGTVPTLYGRADAYHDGTRFRLLETGLTPAVGASEFTEINTRRWLATPGVGPFARAHGIGFASAPEAVARQLRRAHHALRPGHDPVVVIAEGPGGLKEFGHAWYPVRSVLRGHGLDCRVAELGDFSLGRDGLRLRTGSGEVRVDVVFRCFSSSQVLAHPDGPAMLEDVVRAHEEGLAILFSSLNTELYADKGCMALLSDPRWQGADPAERQVIDRILPWTRLLSRHGGPEQAGLLDECRARRTELILKPTATYGGHGVVAGWECDEKRWDEALTRAAAGHAVVQERVVPVPELVYDPRSDREEPWDIVHGIFYGSDGYAGSFARALPSGTNAVINLTTDKNTRLSAVLHHD